MFVKASGIIQLLHHRQICMHSWIGSIFRFSRQIPIMVIISSVIGVFPVQYVICIHTSAAQSWQHQYVCVQCARILAFTFGLRFSSFSYSTIKTRVKWNFAPHYITKDLFVFGNFEPRAELRSKLYGTRRGSVQRHNGYGSNKSICMYNNGSLNMCLLVRVWESIRNGTELRFMKVLASLFCQFY